LSGELKNNCGSRLLRIALGFSAIAALALLGIGPSFFAKDWDFRFGFSLRQIVCPSELAAFLF